MKKHLILLSIFLLSAIAAYPQRGGGGGGGRGQQGTPRQQGQPQGQQQGNIDNGRGQTDRQRTRIDSRQRKQIRDCSNAADRIRKQARDMAQTSGKKFNAGSARRQFSQMQEQFRTMDQEHERLMQGLDAGQQQGFQERIQNMNQIRNQLNAQMQQMNLELGPADPDARRVSEQAREMERTMAELRKQYNTIEAQSE